MLKNHNLASPDDARRISNSTKTENIEPMRLGQELDAEDEAEPVQEEVMGVAGLVGRMIKQFTPSPNGESFESFKNVMYYVCTIVTDCLSRQGVKLCRSCWFFLLFFWFDFFKSRLKNLTGHDFLNFPIFLHFFE